jgi:hypothetical protein
MKAFRFVSIKCGFMETERLPKQAGKLRVKMCRLHQRISLRNVMKAKITATPSGNANNKPFMHT